MRRLYAREPDQPPRMEVYVVAEGGTVPGGAFGVVWWGAGRKLMEKVEAAARSAGAGLYH